MLALGHASFGLVWSRTSTTNSCYSNCFGAHGSGNARLGRSTVITTECGSKVGSVAASVLMPACRSNITTVKTVTKDMT